MNQDAILFPVGNRKRKFKGNTRHYKNGCPFCSDRKKNIVLHMKKYHPKEYEKHTQTLVQAFKAGTIGRIDGFRVVKT